MLTPDPDRGGHGAKEGKDVTLDVLQLNIRPGDLNLEPFLHLMPAGLAERDAEYQNRRRPAGRSAG